MPVLSLPANNTPEVYSEPFNHLHSVTIGQGRYTIGGFRQTISVYAWKPSFVTFSPNTDASNTNDYTVAQPGPPNTEYNKLHHPSDPPSHPPLPDPPNNDSNTAEYSKLNLATGHDYEVVTIEETRREKERTPEKM